MATTNVMLHVLKHLEIYLKGAMRGCSRGLNSRYTTCYQLSQSDCEGLSGFWSALIVLPVVLPLYVTAQNLPPSLSVRMRYMNFKLMILCWQTLHAFYVFIVCIFGQDSPNSIFPI